jgi:hypothetical protein
MTPTFAVPVVLVAPVVVEGVVDMSIRPFVEVARTFGGWWQVRREEQVQPA